MITDAELNELDNLIRNYCEDEVAALCEGYPSEKQSLVIDYMDLFRATGNSEDSQNFADRLTYEPKETIKDLRHAAENYDYPVDKGITPEIRVKGAEYERTVDTLRKDDLGKYITVRGQVNQITQVEPKPRIAAFRCQNNCGTVKKVDQYGNTLKFPDFCEPCESANANWELVDTKTVYEDHQLIELSALPEDTGGEMSETIKVEVTNDLAGMVGAGDRVGISGILKTESADINQSQNPDARRPIFLDGRAIRNEQESFAEIEAKRVDEIKELSEKANIYQLLIDSFAPHIQTEEKGDTQKLAIILALFGGVQKFLPTGSQLRGNINVLMIGDAGTGKSQYLKTAEKLAPKSVLASGKGATAAGLTATAEQSNLTGEWTLSAGALVLANNGVACIDEFDKMSDKVRKSIHEALENQEIPVTKAGINTTLPAKTAVIAAANPKNGEFNRFDDLSEQVDMEAPLVTRFDLIFGLKDEQDEDKDATIATSQHNVAAGNSDVEPEIEYELLREYIAYARQIEPSYTDESVKQELVDYYVEKRKESASNEDSDRPIGPRMNDSLRRIAQASARVRLSDEISLQDAERAKTLMDYTLGQVALDENGNLSGEAHDGGAKSQEEKLDEVFEVISGNRLTVSDVSDELRIDYDEAKRRLDKLVTNDEIDKEANGVYSGPEVV